MKLRKIGVKIQKILDFIWISTQCMGIFTYTFATNLGQMWVNIEYIECLGLGFPPPGNSLKMIGKLLARSRYWHRQTLVIIIRVVVGYVDIRFGRFLSSFFFGFLKRHIGGRSGRVVVMRLI